MKKRRGIFVLIIVAIVLSPILVGLIVSADILNNWTNNNDWIGFWGGYLGSLIGAATAILVMKGTIDHEKKIRRIEDKNHLCEHIINLIVKFNSCTDNLVRSWQRYMSKQVGRTELEKIDDKIRSEDLYLKALEDLTNFNEISSLLVIYVESRKNDSRIVMLEKVLEKHKLIYDIIAQWISFLQRNNFDGMNRKKFDEDIDILYNHISEMKEVGIDFLKANIR